MNQSNSYNRTSTLYFPFNEEQASSYSYITNSKMTGMRNRKDEAILVLFHNLELFFKHGLKTMKQFNYIYMKSICNIFSPFYYKFNKELHSDFKSSLTGTSPNFSSTCKGFRTISRLIALSSSMRNGSGGRSLLVRAPAIFFIDGNRLS